MRRLAMLLALLGSTVIAFVAPAPASAGTVVVEPEPLLFLISAPPTPQTTGPMSLLSPFDEVPWGLDRIDQRDATGNQKYSFDTSGNGVNVYVLDSGINASHPEFDFRVLNGWSYRSNEVALESYKDARDFNTLNPNYGIPECAYSPSTQTYVPNTWDAPETVDLSDFGTKDNNGHGTHVAGSIGGNYTGVAKGVNLIPVRISNSCGRGTASMAEEGLDWVLGNLDASTPAVVNMSYSLLTSVPSIESKITQLISQGVVVVVAAGNMKSLSDTGDACAATPARMNAVITVGSTELNDQESGFSYYGSCVDIFAPGGAILSTWPKTDDYLNFYRILQGTSMATPHVTGAVARYLEGKSRTSTTPIDTWNWLKLNASCNAISYYQPGANERSRLGREKTPNRFLTIGALPAAPCEPSSVSATAVNETVTVEWTSVAAENGSVTLDYTASLSDGGGSCVRTPSQNLSCTFTGLTSGVAYIATVRARNAEGVSTPASVSTEPGLPKAVTNLFANVNANMLDVSWVKGLGDEVGVTYTATAMPGGASCSTSSIGCSISGLTLGTEYIITVFGVNSLGTGVSSLKVVKFVRTPLSVANLAVNVVDNSFLVSWARGIGDSSGVAYTATVSPGGATCSTTSTTCSIAGLTLGTEYTITVVGVNIWGTGTSVSIIKKFVRAPLPVTKLAAVVLGNGLEVSWDQAAGDTTGITYTATAMPGGASCTSAATKCSIAGLTVGTEYTITVVGVNAIGAGAGTSLVKIFSRVPIAVTNLVATAAENALDISWERAGGESASTMYTATATPGDFTCTSTTSSCSIFPLVNGTEYTVSVFGSNEYGDGAATSVKGTPDGAPEVPLTVLSVVNKRTITLSWPAVTSTADVTYVVSSRPGNLMCTTELTTCAVTGLSYGVDYSFTITTRSSTGLTSSAALVGSARPGFKIKKSVVKRGSSTSLTNILVPLSTGKRTWSETGPCSIRGTRLIAPKRATKCVLILKVAKKGSYPAMSTRLKVTVK